jgi:hypothetical protein
VTPVSHEVAHDAEQADELDACVGHAVVGHVADEFGGCSRGFDVGPDAVAVFAEGEGAEGCACGVLLEGRFSCNEDQVERETTYRRRW